MAENDVDGTLKVTGDFTDLEKKSKKATKQVIDDFAKQEQASKKAESAMKKAGAFGQFKGSGGNAAPPNTPVPPPAAEKTVRKILSDEEKLERYRRGAEGRSEVNRGIRTTRRQQDQAEASVRSMERRREREEKRLSDAQESMGRIQDRAERDNVIFDKNKVKREGSMYDDALKEDYIRGQRQQASTQKQIDSDHTEAIRMNNKMESDAQRERDKLESDHVKGLIANKRMSEEALQKMESAHEQGLRMNESKNKKGILKMESAHEEALRMNSAKSKKAEMDMETQHVQALREDSRRDKKAARNEEIEYNKNQQRVTSIMNRAMLAPANMQARISGILNAPGAQSSISSMMAGGMTRQQAYSGLLQQGGIRQNASTFLVGGGGARPPSLGGRGPGFGGINWGRLGMGVLGAAGTALGIGVGVGGIINGAQAAVAATQTATAYNRQRVAAANLSGSQSKLNALLDAYAEASGGAVDKVTELNNVTRLLATGFAKTPEQLDKFVRATRGASIALGKPQDYVIQEAQLAISNTSQKRLDQIGLGIKEVNDEVERLRATNKGWTREMAFQEAVVSLLDKKYGALTETAEGQATGVEKLAKAWKDMGLQFGQNLKGPIDAISEAIAELLDNMTKLLETQQKLAGIRASGLGLDAFKPPADRQGYFERIRAAAMGEAAPTYELGNVPAKSSTYEFMHSRSESDAGRHRARTTPLYTPRFNEDQQNAIDSAYDNIEQIEKNANESRLNEIKNFEQQRESVIIAYGKSIVREEQDFARQRARSLRDYERSIMDIMRDAQDREEDAREDLAETIEDATEDSEKKIAKAEAKYQKDREKATKDHLDRMMKAAGQLDAIAVLEERKRWKRENEEKEEGHKEAIADERESLAERIAEAKEAFDKQLEDSREADAKRLEDMRVNRELQLSDEDEDRETRRIRAEEDHNAQLDEMTRVHEERMTQIQEQADKETKAIEDALAIDLVNMGLYIKGVSDLIKEREDSISDWIEGLIDGIEARANLNPDLFTKPSDGTTPVIRGSSRQGNKSIVFNEGAIQINPLAGTNVYDLRDLVMDTVVQVLEME